MTTYRGIVQKDAIVRSSNRGIKVIATSEKWVTVQFPADVSKAYVQATNVFRGDRVTIPSITVWTDSKETKRLMFENSRQARGEMFFSFQVDT